VKTISSQLTRVSVNEADVCESGTPLDQDRDARVYGLKRGTQTTVDRGNNNNNDNTRLAATFKNITPPNSRARFPLGVQPRWWRGNGWHILADVRSTRWLKDVCRARTHPCPPHQSSVPPFS